MSSALATAKAAWEEKHTCKRQWHEPEPKDPVSSGEGAIKSTTIGIEEAADLVSNLTMHSLFIIFNVI
jgi:hypothetical protein